MRKLHGLSGIAMALGLLFSTQSAHAIDWVYANGYAKTHPNVGLVADEFLKLIAEETGGQLNIRHVGGGTLLKPENMLEGVSSQVAQMGSVVSFLFPGQLPVSAGLGGITDLEIGNRMSPGEVVELTGKLLAEMPEFSAEFEKLGLKAILWVSPPPYALIATKPIKETTDLSGLKFRTVGASFSALLTAAGAAPLSMAYGEIYTSLQTGVIDGAMSDVNGMVPGKWYEVAKHVLTTGPQDGAQNAIAPIVYIVNLNAWNSLPRDVQAGVERAAQRLSPKAVEIVAASALHSIDVLQRAGVTISHLSQAQADSLAAKVSNPYDSAAKTLDGAGLPGRKIVDRYLELAAEYVKSR